jgi:hypothetical protein
MKPLLHRAPPAADEELALECKLLSAHRVFTEEIPVRT